jgi:hypothetical protein
VNRAGGSGFGVRDAEGSMEFDLVLTQWGAALKI